MSHDEDTRRAYEAREAVLHDEATKIQEAEEKGEKQEKLKNAKNLLLMGVDVDIVSQAIVLDIELVKRMKKDLNISNSVKH